MGRVVRQGDHDLSAVAGHWVTLHRVGSDTAGPLDSVRTDPMGRFAFRYRLSGASDAVYFVSATYDGIAYFSQPLAQPVVRGADAEITVFDTTSRPVALRVRGRHLIVGAPARAGLRSVVEVFELSNDTSLTLVAPASAGDRPTWTVDVPPTAVGFRVGQGDVPADAVTLLRGRAEVFAPFAPGLKQFSFSYELPSSAFPLSRPLTDGAGVFEVLLEEPGARVSVPRLRELAPVGVEGRTFRRFLAQDVPPGSSARVTVPVVLGDQRGLYFAVVLTAIGAVMLVALALAFNATPWGVGSLARGRPAR
jgi:hypothetical protein